MSTTAENQWESPMTSTRERARGAVASRSGAGADPAPGDPADRARVLAQVRDAVLSGSPAPAEPRPVVSASWQRSLDAHVDPDGGQPHHVYGRQELDELRAIHPLEPVLPTLRRTLLGIADEAVHMMIVTDARGHILWRDGHLPTLRRADEVSLVEGTRWSEDSVGTNAMGTALADGHAVQIHSAEHLVRLYHPWTCAAAPIHDPDTGELLGVVDLTGPLHTFHPSSLALVSAAAELAEGRLAAELAARDERLRLRNQAHLDRLGGPGALLAPRGRVLSANPAGLLPARIPLPTEGNRVDLGEHGEGVLEPLAEGWLLRLRSTARETARSALTLPFLGAERPVVWVDGRSVRLSLRHAELLTLLALHPEGLTADRLAQALYGDEGNPVSVRSEVHRLRAALGTPVISTQPYRLRGTVDADFLDVRAALRSGRMPTTDALGRGPLLPLSDAPEIRREREFLEAGVRRSVLHHGDADALWALTRSEAGRADVELVRRLRSVLPTTDPRRDELAVSG